MKLMDVFTKLAGGTPAEKTAAAGGDEVDALISSLGLEGQVKTADDREVVKLAGSYLEMGKEIARQVFVAEVLGEGEKVAEPAPEKTEKTKTEEAPAAAEKAAAEKTSDTEVEALMASVGLSEKSASDKAAAEAVKAAADLKDGALRELVSAHLVPAAKTGNAKATEVLRKIAASPKGRELVTEAVKEGKAMSEKSKGSLAKFIAAKKGKGEKK